VAGSVQGGKLGQMAAPAGRRSEPVCVAALGLTGPAHFVSLRVVRGRRGTEVADKAATWLRNGDLVA
jgi:hypothetical protein